MNAKRPVAGRHARATTAQDAKRFIDPPEASWIREIVRLVAVHLLVPESAVHLPDRLVEDFGADAAQRESLTLALEEAFAIDITEEEAAQLRAVRDLVLCVAMHRRRVRALVS